MFESARLKLTVWYLLIIMLISAVFSLIIYQGVTMELRRGVYHEEIRKKAEELNIKLPGKISSREMLKPELNNLTPRKFLQEELEDAKNRVKIFLLFINYGIFVFSAGAGYFLAGRTLQPIEESMEREKRFIADASHELRTPLTSLMTTVEVALRDKKINLKKAIIVLKSNLEDVQSLRSLTDDLLYLTRFQNSSHSMEMSSVNLTYLIKKTSKQILPLVEKDKLKLTLNLNKCSIRGNSESLVNLMLIFLDNAVKYSDTGDKIVVRLFPEGKSAIIEIQDEGVGIKEKDLPHIFDRFFRADDSRSKTKTHGYGLGLSLAQKIVKAHKGLIKVKSRFGKGTVFTVQIPLERA